MSDCIKHILIYKQLMLEHESKFYGLPHSHTSLIKTLILKADFITGLVTDISYSELATLLTIKPAPGRKNSGILNKQTIRNWINSIEKEFPQYFKIISKDQKLQLLFPELPKIYSELLEANTEAENVIHLDNTENQSTLEASNNTELNTQVNTPKTSVKKLFINNKINNNNTDGARGENKTILRTISQDFYPSPDIIARAIAAGHHHVTDAEMIQEFIDKNTAWGSTFADFNPIYLSFLAKHAERTQHKSVPFNTPTRSKDSERTSSKINSYDAALEEVRRYNQNACDPSEDELFPTPKALGIERTTHLVALDGIN